MEIQLFLTMFTENIIQFYDYLMFIRGFPRNSVGKESACNAADAGSIPELGRSPGEGNGNPVFLPGKSRGQRSLADCSPWSWKDQTQFGN